MTEREIADILENYMDDEDMVELSLDENLNAVEDLTKVVVKGDENNDRSQSTTNSQVPAR